MRHLILAIFAPLIASVASAQAFNSGSDGSYGPITVAASQTLILQAPPDGIFHATTVTILSNGTLRFTCNARNTPIYLLATGDVRLAGDIKLDGAAGTSTFGGAGGCGGFAGGEPPISGSAPGDGHGPGGGEAVMSGAGKNAVFGKAITGNSAIYGTNLLLPIIGGSGGGAGTTNPKGGGGGGGAILIASNTLISITPATSVISAAGAIGSGHGSGGAIRMVAPKVGGNGGLQVQGGGDGLSLGRIRIDTLDRSELNLSYTADPPRSVGAIMRAFPDPAPKLDFVNIAGTAIPEGSGPVLINLPGDAPTAQTITVRATNFSGLVPVRVVLTPSSGPRIVADGTITMGGQTSASTVLNVTIPSNVTLTVNAWTR